jgi:hypothetical protein
VKSSKIPPVSPQFFSQILRVFHVGPVKLRPRDNIPSNQIQPRLSGNILFRQLNLHQLPSNLSNFSFSFSLNSCSRTNLPARQWVCCLLTSADWTHYIQHYRRDHEHFICCCCTVPASNKSSFNWTKYFWRDYSVNDNTSLTVRAGNQLCCE